MNLYITQLKAQLDEYTKQQGEADDLPILDYLWDLYSASNPVDDGQIRAHELALAPVFHALPFMASDTLFDLIADLCTAYQRAAFLEGLQVGVNLVAELGGM